MKRREILMALGLAGLGATLGPVRAWAGLIAGPAPLTPRDLIATLGQPASAARIGRACLAERGSEGSAEELTRLLERSLDDRARRSRRALRAALTRRMRDDFGAGSTVRVQGWVLSRTEVRLFTLVALETPVA
jgi:hypothetical protein